MLTFTNARLFDGRQMLPGRRTVTIEGDRIGNVEDRPHALADTAIDLDGMTLMPGLISGHIHPDFFKFSIALGQAGIPLGKEFPPGVMMAIGVRTCRVLLESGFTGYLGAACSNDIDAQLKIAIAEGLIPGPRIRSCGHHLSTTADLSDSRRNWWQHMQTPGTDVFFDGPEELRKAAREEMRRGVQTLKILASDGHDNLRTARNISRDEIAAVVDAAHERGAKVRAHVASKPMMLECIELGVDILDHGDEIDEQCIEAMVKAGTFWVPSQQYTQLMLSLGLGDPGGLLQAQYDRVLRMIPLAHRAGVRILIGDDYSGVFRDALDDDPLDHQVGCYGRELAFYGAIEGVSPADVLAWGTSNPGLLLADPPARVGILETGALADLIVVDGDPTADLTIFARPEQTLKAVVREGKMVIDRLPSKKQRIAA